MPQYPASNPTLHQKRMVLKTNGACLITFLAFKCASCSSNVMTFGFCGVQQHVNVCDKQWSATYNAADIESCHKIGVGREIEAGEGALRSSIATFTTQDLSTRLQVTSILNDTQNQEDRSPAATYPTWLPSRSRDSRLCRMLYLICKRWTHAGCTAASGCAQGAGAEQAVETTLGGNHELRGRTMRQQNISRQAHRQRRR